MDQITVENGRIIRYDWGDGAGEPCGADRLAHLAADADASVQFTGDGCVYSGSTEFALGDEIDIAFVEVTPRWWAPVTPWARSWTRQHWTRPARRVSTRSLDPKPMMQQTHPTARSHGTCWRPVERLMTHSLEIPGTWMIHCFATGTPWNKYRATVFEVVE